MQLPVQFRDLDVAGHVNHATYFQYMETARSELLRMMGAIQGLRPRVIVAAARAEYYRPIREEHQVKVLLWVSRVGNRSWDFDYTIQGPRRIVFAHGRTTQVSYDYSRNSTKEITRSLRKKLEQYFGKPLRFKGDA